MRESPDNGDCPECGAALDCRDGLVYGESVYSGDYDPSVSREDADEVIEDYFKNCPDCDYLYV